MGWGPNEIAEKVAKSFSEIAVACMMIGIARGIPVSYTHLDVYKRQIHTTAKVMENGSMLAIIVPNPALLSYLRAYPKITGM